MIVTVRISDDTYTKICERAPSAPNNEIAKVIETYSDNPLNSRQVILNDSVRKRLEALYGRSIEDQEHFLQWVENLTLANIGDVEVPLTGEQLRRLNSEAQFKNKDPKQHKVTRIKEVLFKGFGFEDANL